MSNKGPAVVVRERGGVWMPAIRLAARGRDLRLIEVRHLDAALEICRERPLCMVAWELLPGKSAEIAEALKQAEVVRPSFSVILADRPPAIDELAWRQLGAIHIVKSPRQVLPIIQIAQRAFAGIPRAATTIEEGVRQRLPWGEYAV